MHAVNLVVSEITGNPSQATVCPELRSEVDGKLICDGIADVDLLNMHEFGEINGIPCPIELLQEDGTPYVKPLIPGAKKFKPNVQERMLVRVERGWNRQSLKKHRAKLLAEHTARIQANEENWAKKPQTDEEVLELVREEPEFVHRILKLMTKMQ